MKVEPYDLKKPINMKLAFFFGSQDGLKIDETCKKKPDICFKLLFLDLVLRPSTLVLLLDQRHLSDEHSRDFLFVMHPFIGKK